MKTFRRLDPPWNTGQNNFFEKITPKLVQNMFGHFWERFWAFLTIWNFFDFLKTFRRLDPPWNTGEIFFSKILTQNMFKTRLDTFGNDLGIFAILKIYFFFENISKSRPSMEHWAKKTFRKVPQNMFKMLLDNLGTILGVFAILTFF